MYYTYAYLRQDGTPYYIGKGKGNRINGKHNIRIPSKDRRLILKKDLTESQAHQHEIYMISIFGRKNNNTGILRNLTDGGEGCSGMIHTEETLKKIKEKRKHQVFGKEIREKYRQATKKRWKEGDLSTPEFREKLSKSLCKKQYLITSPTGEEFYTDNVAKFCRCRGIDYSPLYKIVKGNYKGYKGRKLETYKGWKIKTLE